MVSKSGLEASEYSKVYERHILQIMYDTGHFKQPSNFNEKFIHILVIFKTEYSPLIHLLNREEPLKFF